MTDRVFLEILDEAAAAPAELPLSRARLLERALIGGGAVIAGGVLLGGLPSTGSTAPSASQDVEILNFALLIEYLQASFYAEALAKGALRRERRRFARIVGSHEQAHASLIERTLAGKARQKPRFDFSDTTSEQAKFDQTAVVLEEIGLAAYNGQASNLTKAALGTAAKIVSVEARHASWIRAIVGRVPAPDATDQGKSAAQVSSALNQTGFVRS
jgi:ferritin-like protein